MPTSSRARSGLHLIARSLPNGHTGVGKPPGKTIAGVALAGAILFLCLSPRPVEAQNQGPIPVAVALVVQREVAAGQAFVGTVMPLRTSTVGSAVDERVVEYPINEGDRVARGDVLARLDTTTLQIMLAGAQAELKVCEAERDELVHGPRKEEKQQAQAKLESARAQLDFTQARQSRNLELIKTRTVSPEEFDIVNVAAAQARADYRAAEAALALLEEGTRIEQIDQAKAKVTVQEAECQRIQDLIDKHTIRAPFDGYVVAEHTEVGQWVAKGQAVAQMVKLDEVDVTVNVLEDYVAYLKVGTEARAEVGALPTEAFTGQVVQIVPQADLRSRTFPVKVRIPNPEKNGTVQLKSGMFARVTLPVGQREQALLVPKDALVLGGPSPLVWVVEEIQTAPRTNPDEPESLKGKVRPVPVTLGVSEADMIQVRASLQPGQTVVTEGNERLRPGQEVRWSNP